MSAPRFTAQQVREMADSYRGAYQHIAGDTLAPAEMLDALAALIDDKHDGVEHTQGYAHGYATGSEEGEARGRLAVYREIAKHDPIAYYELDDECIFCKGGRDSHNTDCLFLAAQRATAGGQG